MLEIIYFTPSQLKEGAECQRFGHYSVKWNLFGPNEMGFDLLDPNGHGFILESGDWNFPRNLIWKLKMILVLDFENALSNGLQFWTLMHGVEGRLTLGKAWDFYFGISIGFYFLIGFFSTLMEDGGPQKGHRP